LQTQIYDKSVNCVTSDYRTHQVSWKRVSSEEKVKRQKKKQPRCT